MTSPGEEPGWLSRSRDEWLASGQPWQRYLAGRRAAEGLHPGAGVVRGLDARFSRLACGYGPYFFADLAAAAEDEQAAIDAGEIRATCIRYAGTLR
jgi:hypothetical protein